ncbi:hypothetical protein B0H13DRAFT_2668649 [Mycena leptocephala]|nr:hypothetical protein B0H13DRAFT_2668649 [Mycena leptocephala]
MCYPGPSPFCDGHGLSLESRVFTFAFPPRVHWPSLQATITSPHRRPRLPSTVYHTKTRRVRRRTATHSVHHSSPSVPRTSLAHLPARFDRLQYNPTSPLQTPACRALPIQDARPLCMCRACVAGHALTHREPFPVSHEYHRPLLDEDAPAHPVHPAVSAADRARFPRPHVAFFAYHAPSTPTFRTPPKVDAQHARHVQRPRHTFLIPEVVALSTPHTATVSSEELHSLHAERARPHRRHRHTPPRQSFPSRMWQLKTWPSILGSTLGSILPLTRMPQIRIASINLRGGDSPSPTTSWPPDSADAPRDEAPAVTQCMRRLMRSPWLHMVIQGTTPFIYSYLPTLGSLPCRTRFS